MAGSVRVALCFENLLVEYRKRIKDSAIFVIVVESTRECCRTAWTILVAAHWISLTTCNAHTWSLSLSLSLTNLFIHTSCLQSWGKKRRQSAPTKASTQFNLEYCCRRENAVGGAVGKRLHRRCTMYGVVPNFPTSKQSLGEASSMAGYLPGFLHTFRIRTWDPFDFLWWDRHSLGFQLGMMAISCNQLLRSFNFCPTTSSNPCCMAMV